MDIQIILQWSSFTFILQLENYSVAFYETIHFHSITNYYAHLNGTTLNELRSGHQSFIISIIIIIIITLIWNLQFKVFIFGIFTIHYLIKMFCSTHLFDFTINASKNKKNYKKFQTYKMRKEKNVHFTPTSAGHRAYVTTSTYEQTRKKIVYFRASWMWC